MRLRLRHLPALALLWAMLCAQPGAASPPGIGQVHGTVFDKDRKGVAGLTVALIPASGSTLYGTTTDSDGRYAFKGLDTDTYTVMVARAAAPGIRKDGIRVRALFRSIVDFNLATDPPAQAIPVPHPATPPADGDPADRAAAVSLACALTGPDGEPVPDASITLTPVEGAGSLRRARTDPGGECRLDDVPEGSYRVLASAPGFINWGIGPVTLAEPGNMKLALTLTAYPMGFHGTLEDLLIPADPVPPSP